MHEEYNTELTAQNYEQIHRENNITITLYEKEGASSGVLHPTLHVEAIHLHLQLVFSGMFY